MTSKLFAKNVPSKLPFLLNSFTLNNCTKFPNFKQKIKSLASAANDWIIKRIGNREVVGFGVNGQPEYVDRQDYPFPAIRYKPPSSEILALREKEKGDWRLLSTEEKKCIYRANFCQTIVEICAPTGEWMYVTGWTLVFTSIGLWLFIFMKQYVYSQCPTPDSFQPKCQRKQLQRILNLAVNPINGLSSRWDYENMRWKSRPWFIPWEDPFSEEEEDECVDR